LFETTDIAAHLRLLHVFLDHFTQQRPVRFGRNAGPGRRAPARP